MRRRKVTMFAFWPDDRMYPSWTSRSSEGMTKHIVRVEIREASVARLAARKKAKGGRRVR